MITSWGFNNPFSVMTQLLFLLIDIPVHNAQNYGTDTTGNALQYLRPRMV
jgi:hypothetical protein